MIFRRTDRIPDLLALHAANPERYPHLLQSAAVDGRIGRYDILFAFPGETLSLSHDGALQGPYSETEDFLAALDRWRENEKLSREDSSLPFTGGWFIYLAYEFAEIVEPVLKLDKSDALPLAVAVRCPAAVVVDRVENAAWIVAEGESAALLEDMEADIVAVPEFAPAKISLQSLDEENPEQYLHAVERAIRYIIDGDVFQANLSRQWNAKLSGDIRHADIFSALRKANPGPFNALATFGEAAVISSSPERLVCVHDRIAETRPIAGTRPRGKSADDDAALTRELIGHPKERAEHVMLIDLERNDLGRVAVPGTVEVNELMALESYAHVHHIVSNVRCRLRDEITPGQVIRATFPGGTITGCPKVRCMEIISELEASPRSAYTGSLGYLNRDGSMDLNILIRTMVRDGKSLSFRAGAGIVADSIPERELDETRAKARGMVLSLTGERA